MQALEDFIMENAPESDAVANEDPLDELFPDQSGPPQQLQNDVDNTIAQPKSDVEVTREAFHVENWLDWKTFDGNQEKFTETSVMTALGRAISDIFSFASELNAAAPSVPLPSCPMSIAGSVHPGAMHQVLRNKAAIRYSRAWKRSFKTQLDALTCCFLADPQINSLETCVIAANALWRDLYRDRVDQLRKVYHLGDPELPMWNFREPLQQVIRAIQGNQNVLNRFSDMWQLHQKQICMTVDLLRWEAVEMSLLTQTCNAYRICRCAKTLVNFRVINLQLYDLENVVHLPLR